jgi:hypothetical protein
MSTVFQRTVRASPQRAADAVWQVIVTLIAPDAATTARKELNSIAGIAGTIISARYPEHDAIVVYGNGPRVRIYCIYDESAVSGNGAKEDALPCNPAEGDWKMSLPCAADDLEWLKKALMGKSARFSLRALGEDIDEEEVPRGESKTNSASMNLDAFLKS